MFRSRITMAMLLLSVSTLAVTACSTQERDKLADKAGRSVTQDRDLNMDRDDYRKMLAPRPAADNGASSQIPDLAQVISEEKKNILPQPMVSITVNQDVPLRDIFYELAKQAEVDLELDPTITGSIIFTAHNRPFDQVIDRISEMAGLRYSYKNNVMRIERDTPYMKTYRVDYLSMQRDYTSTINSNTSAASGSGGGGGGGGNGSNSTITSKSSSDFWNELERNITQIIVNTNQQVTLTDQSSSPITTPNAIPAMAANQLAAMGQPNGQVAPAPMANATMPNGMPAPQAANTVPAAMPVPVQQPMAMPMGAGGQQMAGMAAPIPGLANPTGMGTGMGGMNPMMMGAGGMGGGMGGGMAGGMGGGMAGGMGGMGGGMGGGAGGAQQNPYFSVNRQAGMISVFASEKQHHKIGNYLTEMRRAISMQVLIEAKIFEVELNDESATGIDWALLANSGKISIGNTLTRGNFANDPVSSTDGGIFSITSGDFNLVIDAISRFGTVHTLSSPRITVMNNQTAVLNVSESRVFFKLEIDRTEGTTTTPARTDITSEINNVPEGIIITVHPSVDPDTNEITMNLRPSITRVVQTVSDPAVRLISGGDIESFVPELSVREIDSIVKMDSGSTVVMGGLMSDRSDSRQVGIPILGELPVFGPLFRNQRDGIRKTEMVIMLRAKVMGSKPDAVDREIYEKMAQDRHPLSFN